MIVPVQLHMVPCGEKDLSALNKLRKQLNAEVQGMF